jgi:hypothetical protein
VKEERGRRRED